MLNIKVNSKKVMHGDTFVAIRGKEFDGHNYINEAIKNGAEKIICEYGKYSKETVIVNNTKEYLNNYLYNNYYELIKDIKTIGITGTNGKTTSAYLLFQALNCLNIETAYIGTLGFFIKEKRIELDNTTPELIDIYNMLIECKNNNIQYVVMEVSSHSLEMDRLNRINFDYAVFTNLTRDHLDFHKTFGNYALSKRKLFLKLKDKGISIINCDDEYYEKMIVGLSLFYGYNSYNYKIIDYKINNNKMYFDVEIDKIIYTFESSLLGKFNIYNLLITIIILNTLDVDIDTTKEIITKLKSPEGRNYIINYNDNKIVIDYAHTPDAVEKIIFTAKEYTKGKIYCIIGCGGNRDSTKRAIIGNITTNLCDEVVFTDDNPRYENHKNIIRDILNGVERDNFKVLLNRKNAIKYAIKLLKKRDTLLVLGKGHEKYQIIKNKKKKYSDLDAVLKIVKKE